MIACPFCGRRDAQVVRRPTIAAFPEFRAVCYFCRAEGPPSSDAQLALEAWRQRASSPDGSDNLTFRDYVLRLRRGNCWCEMGIGNPNMTQHNEICREITAAIARGDYRGGAYDCQSEENT